MGVTTTEANVRPMFAGGLKLVDDREKSDLWLYCLVSQE